jgi:acyl-CoA thioester hydrolase
MTFPLDGEIRDGRHHMQVRVYYEDTDFPVRFIVQNCQYLCRYLEGVGARESTAR